MRFASIGYFNQIYHLDLAAVERLPELESFYAGSNWRPKVYIAAATDREAVAGRLRRAGFVPDHTVVRLGMRLTPNRTQHRQSSPLSFAITAVAPNEFDEFWHTYLEAFGADPAPLKREDAVANMRLLRCCPGLHFYVAKWEENAVGVGLLRCLGSQASLCGGAVKEPFRNLGAHGGLLAARLQQASDLGAQWISAWADKDGASHRNLVAAGFSLLFEDVVWMRPRASA